jgi:threonine dehydratase
LIYEGKKQYFKIEFPQRAGALKEFIMNTMGPTDDIIYFRYTKHINKEFGPVILGVETKSRYDSEKLIEKMGSSGIVFERLLNVNDI